MVGRMAFVLVGVSAFGVSIASSAIAKEDAGDRRDRGGHVVPCNLDGVNPVHHPDIFGNPAVAAQYGFTRSREGVWRVAANCRR